MKLRTLLSGVLCFTASLLQAQHYTDNTLTNLPVSGSSGQTMDVEASDLDGDGDLDIVLANEHTPNVILFNNGSGVFTNATAGRLPQFNYDSEDIGLKDLDGDGDIDIVFASEDNQVHELYLNNGAGTFSNNNSLLPNSKANAVLVQDINGDGKPDIFLGNEGQNRLLINNLQNNNFLDQTSTRLPQINDVTQDLKLADVDGDGDLDLMVGNENGNRLLINNGIGIFTDESQTRLPQGVNMETRKVTFGDVDADGDLDIFLSNVAFIQGQGKNPQDRLYLNNGLGFFTDGTTSRLPANNGFTLDAVFVDVDLDGDQDLIVAPISAPFYALENDGTGFFSQPITPFIPAAVTGNWLGIKVADLNNDGFQDIYLCNMAGRDRLLLHKGSPNGISKPAKTPETATFIYPNPSKSFFRLSEEVSGAGHLTLTNNSGTEIRTWETKNLSPSHKFAIKGLPAGAYNLQLKTSKTSKAFKLIIE